LTLVSAGRVGRAHGYDGSFYVEQAQHPLPEGTSLLLGGSAHAVERRAGTDARPLVRLEGVADARPLRGELLLVEAELEEDEWLAADLTGCEVAGLGRVERVVAAPSCPLLELDSGALVPFISDAIRSVDVEGRRIEVDREWLG
jgi:16S rRNA processing protein RimM